MIKIVKDLKTETEAIQTQTEELPEMEILGKKLEL